MRRICGIGSGAVVSSQTVTTPALKKHFNILSIGWAVSEKQRVSTQIGDMDMKQETLERWATKFRLLDAELQENPIANLNGFGLWRVKISSRVGVQTWLARTYASPHSAFRALIKHRERYPRR